MSETFKEQLLRVRAQMSIDTADVSDYAPLPDYSAGGYPVVVLHAPERAWENLEWMPLPGFTDVDFWRRRYEELSKAQRNGPLAWSKDGLE
jgi:hypothetical protein